jgi:hypothetical protein
MEKEIIPQVDLAYMAAFLDTDGCVTMGSGRKTKIGHTIVSPSVLFYNRDLSTLEWIQSYLGGKIYDKPRKTKTHSIARQLFLRKQESEILRAVTLLLPYMRIKNRQAALMKEYLEIRGSRGKKNSAHNPPSEREVSIFNELRSLNQGRFYKNSQEKFDGYE